MADFYQVLGVPRDADDNAIKKAYRKLAVRWHPDKNPDRKEEAEAKFQEIAEAYSVLSDKQKRATYDRFGKAGLDGGGGGGPSGAHVFHGDPREIFEQFFGTNNPFSVFEQMGGGGGGGPAGMMFTMGGMPGMGGMGGMPGMGGMGGMPGMGGAAMGGGRAGGPQKAPDVRRQLMCTLEQLYQGATKRLKVTRRRLNPERRDEKILEVHVKAGWKPGTKITFENEGDEEPGKTPANIVFVIGQEDHPRFERKGNDLLFTAKLSLLQALTEHTVNIVTLDGRRLAIPCNEVISPGQTKRVTGEGMPISKQPGKKGDLIIKFQVEFPRHLNERSRQLVKQALQ